MSTLQVGTITGVSNLIFSNVISANATTDLFLGSGNTTGGQIVISANGAGVTISGNSSANNISVTPTSLNVGNSSVNAVVNSSAVSVGANVSLTSTQLSVGNSSVNAVANSTAFYSSGNAISPFSGMRNRIINGDMRIDQRNSGASVTVSNSSLNTFSVDRWQGAGETTDGVFTLQQSSVAPTGFTNSLLATVTTADSSIGVSQRYFIQQRIEGFNTSDFGWGATGAQSVTLSFWVRSSLTGTFGGAIRNSAGDRSYPFSYTISAANTWEKETITIPGDTTGTWVTNNGIGMMVTWGLGVGSSLSGTAGSWAATNYWSSTGATNWISTNAATFYITGVQLEQGSVATPFERRPYGMELALCQRYFSSSSDSFLVDSYGGVAVNIDSGANVQVPFPVTMRATPTLTVSEAVNGGSTTVTQYLHKYGFCRIRKFTGSGSGNIRLAVNSYTADIEL